MNALSDQIFMAEVYGFGILFCVLLWLYIQGQRQNKTRRIAEDLNNRVKVIEMYPSQQDKIKSLEQRMEFMEREMDALRHNSFTGETLRRIK